MLDTAANYMIVDILEPLKKFSFLVGTIDRRGDQFMKIFEYTAVLLMNIYNSWLYLIRNLFHQAKHSLLALFYFLFKLDYSHEGRFFVMVNTANFEYYLLVFFLLLIITLFLQLLV